MRGWTAVIWTRSMMSVGIARQLARRDEGQDLVEYGLVAALVSLFAVGAVTAVGEAVYETFWRVIAEAFS